MVVWKFLLGEITIRTTDLQKNIQECNNILKTVIFHEVLCGHCGTVFQYTVYL